MTPGQSLAALPEPIQTALVDLVRAVIGLSQQEKTTGVQSFRRHAWKADPSAIDAVFLGLADVIDELHTAATPASARASLARVKKSHARVSEILRADPDAARNATVSLSTDGSAEGTP